MTLPVQIPVVAYVGNGVTTLFTFPFTIFEAEDLVVELNSIAQGSGFAVAGVGEVSGDVTFTVAPAAGVPVVLYRRTALARDIDYQDNGDLLAPTLNQDFDRLWGAQQELGQSLVQAVQIPFENAGQGTLLPGAAARASKAMILDQFGNVIVSQQNWEEPQGIKDDAKAVAEVLVAGVAPGAGTGFFLADGVGSVARTFQSKERDFLSVKDKGAIGDGVTDDTMAIVNAIAAIAPGGILYFPPGTYLVEPDAITTNKAIVMTSFARFKWAATSYASVRLKAATSGGYLLSFDGNFTGGTSGTKVLGGGLQGIALDGNGKTLSTGIFNLHQYSEFSVVGLGIQNAVGRAVRLSNTFETKFDDVFVNNIDATGTADQNVFYVDNYENADLNQNVNNLKVYNSRFESNKGHIVGAGAATNLDIFNIHNTKFEWGLSAAPAGGPYFVFNFLSGSRLDIGDGTTLTHFASANGYGILKVSGAARDAQIAFHDVSMSFEDPATVLLAADGGVNVEFYNNRVLNGSSVQWGAANIQNTSKYALRFEWPRVQPTISGRGAGYSSFGQPLSGRMGGTSMHDIASTSVTFVADASCNDIRGTVAKVNAGQNSTIASIPLSCFAHYNQDLTISIVMRTDATDSNSKIGVVTTNGFSQSVTCAASPAGYAAYDITVPLAYLQTLGNSAADTLTLFSATGSTAPIYIEKVFIH
ncbi:glycosyl hydrolase family 28-related protein [Paraburkholderia sp. D1E]|uniref:glycosyl hydrolase family 28-related protein n=1 Tax=Paraburkholderia sp. D1E TaxID=3461398 RepID=UPI004046880B